MRCESEGSFRHSPIEPPLRRARFGRAPVALDSRRAGGEHDRDPRLAASRALLLSKGTFRRHRFRRHLAGRQISRPVEGSPQSSTRAPAGRVGAAVEPTRESPWRSRRRRRSNLPGISQAQGPRGRGNSGKQVTSPLSTRWPHRRGKPVSGESLRSRDRGGTSPRHVRDQSEAPMPVPTSTDLSPTDTFLERHLGPSPAEQAKMLSELGFATLDDLTAAAVPATIRSHERLDLPAALGESETTEVLRAMASQNDVVPSLIGLGYHGTITPARDPAERARGPGWYTAYTPYQPEISQGRLEALLNFQTMVSELTGYRARERFAPRRADRGGRGDGDGPPPRAGGSIVSLRDRRRMPPAHRRSGADPSRAARHHGRGRRRGRARR